MISKKTVLILGAGSSKNFDVYLGEELKLKIAEFYSNTNSYDFLNNDERKLASELSRRLYGPGINSIDEFLVENNEFMKLGKIAIWHHISEREYNTKNKFFTGRKYDWIEKIFHLMKSSVSAEDFHKNELKVITFNYERIFLQGLYESAINFYNKSKQDLIANKISNIEVVHVHGSLGKLPFEIVENANTLEFGRTKQLQEIPNYINDLKIISEAEKESTEFKRAREIIEWADRIVLLGFGFNDENINKLFKINKDEREILLKGKQIFSTGFGLEITHKYKISNSLNRQFYPIENYYLDKLNRMPSNTIYFSDIQTSCLHFFRDKIALDVD